jgi:hypothetical protein
MLCLASGSGEPNIINKLKKIRALNRDAQVIDTTNLFQETIPRGILASEAIAYLENIGFRVIKVSNRHVVLKTCHEAQILFVAKAQLEPIPFMQGDECEVILCVRNKIIIQVLSFIKRRSL